MKYEKKITGSMKQNPKQFFKYLNSKRKIKSGVSELKDNKGNLCNDVQENANILGEFFASTFVQEPADENFLNGATNYTDKEISDIEISSYEVETLLKEINIYRSEGPDKIHSKLLKSLCDNTNFVDAVTKLFRKCYETGCLPDVWKTAKINALYKKGSKCEAKNYRPISLTCILCKVFEKIIRNHILKHFEPFVHSSQRGFLSGKSCLSNLLNCFEKVDELLENNDNVDIIYLDFQKAFDSVPHKRLMHKLKMYGITGKTLTRTMKFDSITKHTCKVDDSILLKDNDLLVFSRVSQDFYHHSIVSDESATGVRYSFTFRCLAPYNLNYTKIIGDSKTQELVFGPDRGKLGQWLPGALMKASKIANIPDPFSIGPCRNAVIHVGLNDVQAHNPKSAQFLSNLFESKIKSILSVYPKKKIFLSLLLPTKDTKLNFRVNELNYCLKQ